MNHQKNINEELLKKLATMLNKYKRDEPLYMTTYMKIKRRTEKLPPSKKTELERDTENLLNKFKEALNLP
jgi:hypothetical protein